MRRLARTLAISILLSAPARAQEAPRSTWIADANAGVPRLRSSGDFNLIGDLTAGYAAPRWGAIAYGSAHTFALDDTNTHSDLDAYSGLAEGWLRFGDESAAFEIRTRLGASLYDTTFIQAPVGSVTFQDETSVFYRGALLVGARLRPNEQFVLHALVGGGVYDEEYNATQVSGGSAAIVDTSRFAGRAEARFEGHWRAVPNTVSLRLRSEMEYYTLTRSTDVIAIVGGNVGTTSSTDTLRQFETHDYLFVHVDALEFAGILPALFAGIDTLSVSAAGASKTDVVPIIGIDLFKPEP